jgi:Tol biopolymer transport system component
MYLNNSLVLFLFKKIIVNSYENFSMGKGLKFFLFFIFILIYQISNAQFYTGSQLNFGKNRVQYRYEKIWSLMKFENFDIYYYQKGYPTAVNVARYADSIIYLYQSKLNYRLNTKIQFLVFNSLSDLKSSNIGIDDELLYNSAGQTIIQRNKIFLYFNGSYVDLFKQVREGIAKVMVVRLLYGESFGANLKNQTLNAIPSWYIDGLVSYLAEPWSTEMDDYLRVNILDKKFKRFNQLEGEQARIAGHSIWRYMIDVYGANMISNFIYMTRISRSVSDGIMYTFGVSYKDFIDTWYNYYYKMYYNEVTQWDDWQSINNLKISKKDLPYKIALNSNGENAVIVSDRMNQKRVYLVPLSNPKDKKLILKLGPKVEEAFDDSYPLIAFHPYAPLFTCYYENKGQRMFMLYNIEEDSKEYIKIESVDKVTSISYSPDGLNLVMSAINEGQSDIYLFSFAGKSVTNITKDFYDDYAPVYINRNQIAFLSNRPSDTLEFIRKTYKYDYFSWHDEPGKYDVFIYDNRKPNILIRGTNTPYVNENQIIPYTKNEFLFLSDSNGVNNLFIANIDSSLLLVDTVMQYKYFANYKPITNLKNSILTASVTDDKALIITREKNNKHAISLLTLDISPIENLPLSNYKKQQLKKLSNNFQSQKIKEEKILEMQRQNYQIIGNDSLIDIYNYKLEQDSLPIITGQTNNINKRKVVGLTQNTKSLTNFALPKSETYEIGYFIDQVTTQFDFSFLNASYQPYTGYGPIFIQPGMNALFMLNLTDLLEDHRIILGTHLSGSLDENEYIISYEDLSRRLDRQVVFHRYSYYLNDEYYLNKNIITDLHYRIKYPFNQVSAIRLDVFAKYDNIVYKSIDDAGLLKPNDYKLWGGGVLDFTYDNTRNPMINIYYGTRAKIFFEYYQGLINNNLNMFNVGFDFRNYTKIYRTLIWANRIAGATSFGSTKLIYILGGVDNWLFPNYMYQPVLDPNMNFSFQTLATNLRGMPQNIRNGNSFFVINSEIRFPIFRFIFNRPIKSNFLNTFQLNFFGDLGSAWIGLNPYSDINIYVPEYYYNKPITVVINNPRNPLVGGVGVGARAELLGYFMRLDYAWGVEEKGLRSPKLIFSITKDF